MPRSEARQAHELRNPLAPIRKLLEVMKRVDVNRELIQPALGTMERQLRHRTRLIDDLLDASRISQGKISNSNPIATATPVQAVDDIS